MPIRQAVADFLAGGGLPDENQPEEVIQRAQDLLERISEPVTDEEAQALVAGFGPDDCYGLEGTLLHLIETAPGAWTAQYPAGTGKPGVERLRDRVENVRGSDPPPDWRSSR